MELMNWLQGVLSDVISLLFSPKKDDVHGWPTIIAVLGFLVLVGVLGSMVRG